MCIRDRPGGDLPGGVFQPFVKEKNEMNYLEIEKVIGRETVSYTHLLCSYRGGS